ncbi:MAG: hypothetical protein D3923_07070 [Candidatus Electrothrix sp. AR3]|nr:hypothetical protein [Candidatus Electrothrix sp. AR3]
MKLIIDQSRLFVLSCFLVFFFIAETAQGKYLKENFTTLIGRVQGSYTDSPPGTTYKGFHLKLTTNYMQYIIHLGPQWYVDNFPERFKFKKGDLLTVSGASFALNNIYAASVTNHSSGASKLQLRDPETGLGLWAGQFKDKMRDIIKNKVKARMQQGGQIGISIPEELVLR